MALPVQPDATTAAAAGGFDPAPWRALLDVVGEAIVVVDADDVVRVASKEAVRLFPQLANGAGTTAALAAHRLAWRVNELDGGFRVMRAVSPAEQRDGLLTSAARLVEGALSTERVAAGLVGLAAPALAEVALLVLPGARARFDWWRSMGGDSVEQGRITQQVGYDTPGLAQLCGEQESAEPYLGTAVRGHNWLAPVGVVARTVLMMPLSGTPGVLVLVNPRAVEAELVAEFARRVAAALCAARRLDQQAELTVGLESSLLPSALPELAGMTFAAAYRPARAGLRVGGDFYDVHPQPDGSAVFALGDACGHGPEAASLAGHVRSCLGALRLVESEPSRLLALLNHAIRTTSGSRFTTAVVGSLAAVVGGRVRLVLGGAGHPAPLILRASGQVDEVELTGGLLGIYPDIQFGQTEIMLGPGEVCLLYSDGVTEARRGDDAGEQFGVERLRLLVSQFTDAPVADLVDAVHAAVDTWLAGRYHDDITVLAIQANPI